VSTKMRSLFHFADSAPDAVFVVSLKGSFLYVSPSITRLLDYDADYFLNKNLADICHPSDLAPTMRNVKESTSAATTGTSNPALLNPTSTASNDVELLFRARRSNGTYVWLDCPGKLHADTSRGRKALLLRLRKVDIPRITWGTINSAGGVYKDDAYLRVAKDDRGLIVACSKSIEEVLGGKRDEFIGKTLLEMLVGDSDGSKGEAIRAALGGGGLGGIDTLCASPNLESSAAKVVYCKLPALMSGKRSQKMKTRTTGGSSDAGTNANGKTVVPASVELTFFPVLDTPDRDEDSASAWRSKLRTVIVRIRVIQRYAMRNDLRDETVTPTSGYPPTSAKGAYAAPPTSASSAFPSTSGQGIPGYRPGANEMPLGSLSQQVNTPLQLFQSSDSSRSNSMGVRKGYQVPLTGNVNEIDDSVPGNVSPPSNDGYGPSSAVGNEAIGIGSSWLYDLEQLRKRNQALRAELAEVKRGQRAKQRARGGPSFNAGRAHNAQQLHLDGSQSQNINMAQLDALASASASGLNAMNARRAGVVPNTTATTWAVPFPGAGVGDTNGNGNQPGLSLTMPPPALPRQLGEDNHKRSWSQTDMHLHSEWHH
jgi:hypothetical protein